MLRKMPTEHHVGNVTIEEHLRILFDIQQRSDTDKKVLTAFAVLPVNCECSIEEIEQWFGFENEDLDEVIKDGWLSYDEDKQVYSMHPLIRTIIRFDFLADGQGKKTIAPEGTTDKILEYYNSSGIDSEITKAIIEAKEKIGFCKVCGNFTDREICPICQRRNRKIVCVVAQPKDILALEKVKEYDGVYHVLFGTISPLEHRGPNDIKIK